MTADPGDMDHATDTTWRRRARSLVTFLAATFLTLVCGLLLAAVAPAAANMRAVVVTSGSMTPSIRPGDVVLTESPTGTPAPDTGHDTDTDPLVPGRVIVIDDPAEPGRLLTHRIEAVAADGTLTTKGDANEVADSTPVPRARVVGIARAVVPAAGRPLLWWRTHDWGPLAGYAAATIAAAATLSGATRAGRGARFGRARPSATLATLAVAILTGLGLLISPSAAAWTGATGTPSSTFTGGTVALSSVASGARLTTSNLKPGDTFERCVPVVYTGSLASAQVRLYGTATGTAAQALRFTVTRGTMPLFPTPTGACGTYTPDGSGAQLWTGTMDAFPSTWGTGLVDPASWTTNSYHVYRFTVTVLDSTLIAGGTATLNLSWQAQLP